MSGKPPGSYALPGNAPALWRLFVQEKGGRFSADILDRYASRGLMKRERDCLNDSSYAYTDDEQSSFVRSC